MKKYIIKTSIAFLALGTILTACKKDLQQKPVTGVSTELAYKDFAGYQAVLAKVYGSFALTGNQGPAGNGDIQGIDEGTSDFLRLYWWVQEISTDEAVVQVGWTDPGIHFFHSMNWSSDNVITKGVFYRSYYQITLANEFIRQSADGVVASHGITGPDAETIKTYALEARFLRAYQYSVLIDLFGNVPFVTENDAIGGDLPKQIMRADLFNYIETELKDLEGKLPVTAEYGRANRSAVTALLARMYLNAEVYTGTGRYNDAATYASKTLSDGFTLIPDYRQLMLADDNTNTSEFIMTINYDGVHTQSYGGTTFLTHAPVGGSMSAANFGIAGGWAGLRTTSALVALFPDATGTADQRSQFYTSGQSLTLSAEPAPSFTEGYAVSKYRNVRKDGVQGSSADFSDIDFPIFRSAEMNLIYAEAVLRGATTGDIATAVSLINDLRTRAGADNITSSDLNLNFIINERGRELYWECFRRTDLIRFNEFVEDTYLWPWKGGNATGTSVPAYRKLFPLPNTEINSNPNLVQNPGY